MKGMKEKIFPREDPFLTLSQPSGSVISSFQELLSTMTNRIFSSFGSKNDQFISWLRCLGNNSITQWTKK